jgi:hypothetical protein
MVPLAAIGSSTGLPPPHVSSGRTVSNSGRLPLEGGFFFADRLPLTLKLIGQMHITAISNKKRRQG